MGFLNVNLDADLLIGLKTGAPLYLAPVRTQLAVRSTVNAELVKTKKSFGRCAVGADEARCKEKIRQIRARIVAVGDR